MQYYEYIKLDQARREREIQLANQYNQKPEGQRVKNLWMVGVEKHSTLRVTAKEVLSILAGMAIVTSILVLSIILG